jgi:hypothetical protein
MDIINRLEGLLEKDQIVARNWNEYGEDIERDIEEAINEIERLRSLVVDKPNK